MSAKYESYDKSYTYDEIRKMTDDDLFRFLGEVRAEGYCEGYDDGYINAREDCW